MLFLRRFLRDEQLESAATVLYDRFACQARQPDFYLSFDVPDTVDGRFEMMALHAYLVFQRLKGQGPEIDRLTQATYDVMFKQMDLALRELGAADLGVGKRIKHMTESLNGRIQVYDRALGQTGETELQDVLRRNLYGTVEVSDQALAAMTAYMRAAAKLLAQQDTVILAAGDIQFPALSQFIL
jgi:cytochrome b pre-mRNA-processing protein 3